MSNQTRNQNRPKGGQAPFTAQKAEETVAVEDKNVPTEATVEETLPFEQPKKPFEPPHYDFAGANLGGQSVYNCGICWTTVLRDAQTAHTEWHRRLES